MHAFLTYIFAKAYPAAARFVCDSWPTCNNSAENQLTKFCAFETVKANPGQFFSSTPQSFCIFILKIGLVFLRLRLTTREMIQTHVT